MPDLSVEVRDQDIIVTKPSQGLAVTYRRAGPMMVALGLDARPFRPGRGRFFCACVEGRVRQSEGAGVARTPPTNNGNLDATRMLAPSRMDGKQSSVVSQTPFCI